MRPGDVVEVSCVVDRDGVRPLPIGAIPEAQELLMRQVKLYERLTVEAIASRSRATAVAALMAHPLVLSHSRAAPLVDEYWRRIGHTWRSGNDCRLIIAICNLQSGALWANLQFVHARTFGTTSSARRATMPAG